MAYDLFRQVSSIVFTPKCFDNYFLDFNFTDVPCFKTTLSKVLGLGLILGSILVKVPQIVKIIKSKSGEGINLFSVSLDLTAITIYMAYSFVNGFPFSSWGDTFFLAIQTVLIGSLVLYYSGKVAESILYLALYLVACFVLMGGVTPINVLWTLTSINIIIVVMGKLLQARTNYMNGHTGQLAAITLVMLFAGSLARIFTSIQETGDTIAILTYVASTAANAVLVIQLVYYWKATEQMKNKKKKE
ncbi:mannose-P-dolichol utilization defect 1 protein homolog [Anthonomus grandis grandis]|uniref:mannose-P-dolichol utilization defect 1 protein homolog n=1 Tax=Anthonomus grandis grandis TaxID=2921223 RepID=UPI002166B0F6|nr:mannose-P-dolichol utilization defect 1 protein homolog [Anthonomus grandis grandis]